MRNEPHRSHNPCLTVRSTLPAPASCFVFVLVPKLRLGTRVLEALLPEADPSKQSLLDMRSQAELGNERSLSPFHDAGYHIIPAHMPE